MDYNIPDGDDAHLIFLPLPDDIDHEVEDWFYTEVSEMTRPDSVQFLKDLSNMPKDVMEKIRKHKTRARLSVNVEEEETKTIVRNAYLTYFRPTILHDLTKSDKGQGWDVTRGNYRFCVHVRGSGSARIIFDAIKVSEYEKKAQRKHVVKKEHLTPLERSLEDTSATAKTIIDDMHYMEKREIRMKRTADGTNSRIKWFSYLSISILMGVTYFQMTNLKGYFKKKKVL